MPVPPANSSFDDVVGPGRPGQTGVLTSAILGAFAKGVPTRTGRTLRLPYQDDDYNQQTLVVELDESGGASGQTGQSRAQYVRLYKRATAAPATSELTTADWDGDGWAVRPTGWYALISDVPTLANSVLYEAESLASYDGSNWSLSAWSITARNAFNTRYSDSLAGTSPYTTYQSSAAAYDIRDAVTGAWRNQWIPIAQNTPAWQTMATLDLASITTNAAALLTVPNGLNIYNINELLFAVHVRTAGSVADAFFSQAVYRPSVNGIALIDMTPPGGTPSGAAQNVLVESDNGEMFVAPTQRAARAFGAGSTVGFSCKLGFRRRPTGHYGDVEAITIHSWGSYNQHGTFRVFWR